MVAELLVATRHAGKRTIHALRSCILCFMSELLGCHLAHVPASTAPVILRLMKPEDF